MAVILDGKGFIEPDQVRGSDKEDFVHEALTQITILEKEQRRHIPKCVLTAWYDKLLDSLQSRVQVYDKKKLGLDDNIKANMFNYLKEEVKNSELYKIRKPYSQVFETIGSKGLPIENDTRLYLALSKLNEATVEKSDFNNLRDMLESVLKTINKADPLLLPDSLFKADGRPNLEYCIRYLGGTAITQNNQELFSKVGGPRIPEHIVKSMEFVKNTASIFSHDYTEKWSMYIYNSIVFSICEIFLWCKGFLNKKSLSYS
jgi:hypothetical protein